ncbi:MAG: HAMP domain-containing histidine kinase [Elusimicrobia bacterium]|nr:HAMP domain-containing histidine kinase [Elusimicrobiota bacterium]
MEDKTAAYLTHELRAPLTAVRCALELLRDGGDPATDAEVLQIALRNVERLAGLIDDILETSQLQTGRLPLSSRPLESGCAARDAVTALLPWADRKGVKLAVVREADLPPVAGDPKRLTQVLTNLISNALKFTPAGGRVEVSVRRGRRDRAGSVVFCVRDTGPGIDPEEQTKLFRYFAQGAAGKAAGGGTGLGLAIARAMVELMGGSMWLESEPGRGAGFYFTLPVHIALSTAASAPLEGGSRAFEEGAGRREDGQDRPEGHHDGRAGRGVEPVRRDHP